MLVSPRAHWQCLQIIWLSQLGGRVEARDTVKCPQLTEQPFSAEWSSTNVSVLRLTNPTAKITARNCTEVCEMQQGRRQHPHAVTGFRRNCPIGATPFLPVSAVGNPCCSCYQLYSVFCSLWWRSRAEISSTVVIIHFPRFHLKRKLHRLFHQMVF